jgi:hypothetical protein
MTNTIRLVNSQYSLTLRPNVPSKNDPFFVTDSELMFPTVRVDQYPRTGRTGVDDFTGFFDNAVFHATIRVQDVVGTTRHQSVDILRAMCMPGAGTQLFIQRDGWLTERWANVRGDTLSCVIGSKSRVILDVSIQLSLPDGIMQDTVQQTRTLTPAGLNVGRIYSTTQKIYPWNYAAGSTTFASTIVANGSIPVMPILHIYGACTNPTVRNVTTGKSISFLGLTLVDGQYIDVNISKRTVYLNSDTTLSYYSFLNFATSSWWTLVPGNNLIQVTAATADTQSILTVVWYDGWI